MIPGLGGGRENEEQERNAAGNGKQGGLNYIPLSSLEVTRRNAVRHTH